MLRFKPNRPIYLNTENTGKSAAEVILIVEQLRTLGWLCTVGFGNPFHLSFDDLSELAAFKKDCAKVGLEFKSDLILPDSVFSLEEAKSEVSEVDLDTKIEVTAEKKSKSKSK